MRILSSGVRNPVRVAANFILLATFLFVSLSCDSRRQEKELQPQEYIKKSQDYYNLAVKRYKDLIAVSKDPRQLYFALGKLYYDHGQLEEAVEELKRSPQESSWKFIAISYYRMGNFTDALDVFNRKKMDDDEYRYYHGLTCERLNLFDQAVSVYKEIKSSLYAPKARQRLEIIEKELNPVHIQDIDPRISAIISSSPTASEYPQAGAPVLFADEKTEITADNTQVSEFHYLIKILNERGKEDFAEAAIEYDSTFEKVELEYARTIKPDGRVVNVGSRHIRDVSKYLNFPLYSNARVYIISFPEVAIGSCLEYRFKIKSSQLINKKDFVVNYPVQNSEPVLSSTFNVTIPKDRKLNLKVLNEKYNDFSASLEPETKSVDDKIIYSWNFSKIPQIIPEANMPPDVELNPTLLLSTFKSWEEFYNWWWGLAKDKIKADNAIKEKVKSLIQGKSDDAQKARAIYNFCAKEIRYVAVEYGQAGFEPHAAADIFKNKYGDCKDQAILLVTMLREAGLKAKPVLIGIKQHYNLNEDFPTSSFNHCIAVLYLGDKIFFLDPTADTCSFGDLPPSDQERKVLVFDDKGYDIIDTPLYSARHNLVDQDLRIKINKDGGIAAQKNIYTNGFYDQAQRHWLLYTQPDLVEDALNNVIQDISIGAKLDSYNVENINDLDRPVVLSYNFHGPEYLTISGNLRIMPQLAFIDSSLVSKPDRKYPIDLGVLDMRENLSEIELPDGFEVKNMPDSLTKDSPWVIFKVEYRKNKNKITFKQIIESKKTDVTQEEYAQFKSFIEELARAIKQRVVLEKVR